jgi:hypothetical protein
LVSKLPKLPWSFCIPALKETIEGDWVVGHNLFKKNTTTAVEMHIICIEKRESNFYLEIADVY